MFKDLAAGLQLEPETLLLKHYMPRRAPPALLAFQRSHGATLRIETAVAGASRLRLKTCAGTLALDIDAALLPLCRWIAAAGAAAMPFAEACANSGGADESEVWQLFAALEDAGWLEAFVEPAPAAPSAAPRVVRHASKR